MVVRVTISVVVEGLMKEATSKAMFAAVPRLPETWPQVVKYPCIPTVNLRRHQQGSSNCSEWEVPALEVEFASSSECLVVAFDAVVP